MQDKIGHNESRDPFSCYIKQRLEDHRLPVEPEVWNELESHIWQKKWRAPIWIVCLLAAALLTGLAWLFFSPQTMTSPDILVEQSTPVINTPVSPIDQSGNLDKKVPPLSIKKENSLSQLADSSPKEKNNNSVITTIEDPTASENTMETEIIISEQVIEEEPNNMGADNSQEKIEKKSNPSLLFPQSNNSNQYEFEPPIRKKQKRLLIAATVGTGQNTSILDINRSNNQSNDYYNNSEGNNSHIPEPPSMNSWMKLEDYSDFKYSLPLSFGLTARIPLNNKWSIESGIIYTYLSTKMSGRKTFNVDGKLGLHYLGIPINIVYTVWNNPNWNIYASGGMILEKGIRAVYTEKIHYLDRIISTTGRTKIDGMQLSLNGAIGFTYLFYNQWGLYVEPKLYYYFDNNQPISSRTNHQFGVGINAGVRYQF